MGRPKAWWKADLFSWGCRYIRGEIDGFHVVVRAEDGTESGRYIDVELTDGSVRLLAIAMQEYLNRDKGEDVDPIITKEDTA